MDTLIEMRWIAAKSAFNLAEKAAINMWKFASAFDRKVGHLQEATYMAGHLSYAQNTYRSKHGRQV